MESLQLPRRDILKRTFRFSVAVVNLANLLPKTPAGYAISNQIIRSGTSIGANVEEAQDGLSRKDFIHSMNIALKEARETKYWLKIIMETKLLDESQGVILVQENTELIRILTAIVKTSKNS